MVGNIIYASVTDTKDPDALGRVKVKLLAYNPQPELWLRMLMPYASKEAGFIFLPEVGDEVVVLRGAEDDVEGMLILGALYNGARVTLYSNDDGENITKSIRTRAGTHLTISDKDSEESVTIETKASNKIFISDKSDLNGFQIDNADGTISVTLSKDGATVKVNNGKDLSVTVQGDSTVTTTGNTTLKTTGNTDITSTGNISAKATGNMTVEGVNVTVSASAQAEIKAAATVKVSAAMVNIN